MKNIKAGDFIVCGWYNKTSVFELVCIVEGYDNAFNNTIDTVAGAYLKIPETGNIGDIWIGGGCDPRYYVRAATPDEKKWLLSRLRWNGYQYDEKENRVYEPKVCFDCAYCSNESTGHGEVCDLENRGVKDMYSEKCSRFVKADIPEYDCVDLPCNTDCKWCDHWLSFFADKDVVHCVDCGKKLK